MAWTTPRTWTDGELVTAALLNAHIRDNLTALAYSSGTYTPTYQGLTTGGTTTYTVQQGTYRRIGDLVIAQIEVTWSNATGTGAAIVSLPVAAAATMEFAMPVYVSGVTFAGGSPVALINTGAAYFLIGTPVTNTATATIAVEAAGTIFATAIYFA